MFLYITVTGPITIILIITIITRETESNEALRGEKRAKEERLRNEKGRRRGQRFPSTPVHDLILFRSTETVAGMRIC